MFNGQDPQGFFRLIVKVTPGARHCWKEGPSQKPLRGFCFLVRILMPLAFLPVSWFRPYYKWVVAFECQGIYNEIMYKPTLFTGVCEEILE